MKITKNKGMALILSVIILTAVLAIALTAGKIFTDRIKMSRNTSDSMKAYYAAESGIEYALYQIKNSQEIEASHKCNVDMTNWQTVDGAFYCLKQEGDTIKAIGKAGEARRGVEVEVAQAQTYSVCFSVCNSYCSLSPISPPACPIGKILTSYITQGSIFSSGGCNVMMTGCNVCCQ